MVTTALLRGVCGTERDIAQEGIAEAISAEACYVGWQDSPVLLARLVEPESAD